ncbi:DUF4188 domain-containing protein [Psychrobacillus soli]|nr:DUF4188 domain-containing protein [Psychrobacillus soli]
MNKRLAIQKWLPVFNTMPGMIKELYVNKEELYQYASLWLRKGIEPYSRYGRTKFC